MGKMGRPDANLRTWRVGRFPLVWCYFERDDRLDVVRLLGERQDMAAILRDGQGLFSAQEAVAVPEDFLGSAERDQGPDDRDPLEGGDG